MSEFSTHIGLDSGLKIGRSEEFSFSTPLGFDWRVPRPLDANPPEDPHADKPLTEKERKDLLLEDYREDIADAVGIGSGGVIFDTANLSYPEHGAPVHLRPLKITPEFLEAINAELRLLIPEREWADRGLTHLGPSTVEGEGDGPLEWGMWFPHCRALIVLNLNPIKDRVAFNARVHYARKHGLHFAYTTTPVWPDPKDIAAWLTSLGVLPVKS